MGAGGIRVAHRLALCPEPNGDASNLIQLTPAGQFTGGKLRPRELSWPVDKRITTPRVCLSVLLQCRIGYGF